ncbi:MAG: hypothetical protein L6R39_002282 [Caloplaca ligustica]|nr:MAG: hypothetical protein L6R39_002282 [Caloplaca ligustica]
MAKIGEGHLYHYYPSLIAAVITIVVFAILSAFHTYRMIRSKYFFCLPFAIGGIFEIIGYIGRVIGHYDPESLIAYILQSLFILVAPALFAATIYMTLGRIIRATHAESYSVIRTNWLTKLFVAGDVLTFCIQGGGGGLMAAGDPDKVKLGQNTILGGLFLQIVIFSLFVIVSIIFHTRLRKQPTRQSAGKSVMWQKMLVVLYVVSALILVRNVFRVVEYVGGRDGPLLRIEWPIYVFDALLMAATMGVWGVWYPSSMLPRVDRAGDAEEGVPLPDAHGHYFGAVANK